MANELISIDASGLTVGSFDEAKQAFDRDVTEVFGGNIDDHSHTPQQQFAAINAAVWAEMNEEILRATLYGADLDVAPGKYLDALGSLLDIRRRPATKTTVVCQVRGVAGTIIPRGSIVQDNAGNRYESDTQISIPADGASGTLTCTALEFGAISVGANTISKIISVTNGWEQVSNAEAGVPGQDRESDTEYRANIKARTTINASSTLGALGSALNQAGANKYKIVENPTGAARVDGGITIPAHSIMIAASGGLSDDIARAVINNRGMGVNIFTAQEGSQSYDKSTVANMPKARFLFNGSLFKDIDLSGTGNATQVATALNAYPSPPAHYPTFSGSGNQLLSFFDWDRSATGFKDVDGQVSSAATRTDGFYVYEAQQYGRRIRVRFNRQIGAADALSGTNAPYAEIVSPSTNPDVYIGTSVIAGNMLEFTANNDFDFSTPQSSLNIVFEKNVGGVRSSNLRSDDYIEAPITVAVDRIPTDDDSGPLHLRSFAMPGTSVAIGWASCIVPSSDAGKQIAKWQYRRNDGTGIIPADANWVDIANSASQTVNVNLSGFNNSSGAQLEFRVTNVDGEQAITLTNNFDTSAAAITYTPSDVVADSRIITIPTSIPVWPNERTTNLNAWTVSWSGGSTTVSNEYCNGSTITLYLASAVPENTPISLRYSSSAGGGSSRVRSVYGNYMGNQAAATITNATSNGIPARPGYVRAYRTSVFGNDTTLSWIANVDGGTTIDRYEYRSRDAGDVNWGDWQAITPASLRRFNASGTLAEVQMRASNPNIRFVETFGLSTVTAPPPYLRGVKYRLKVGIQLRNTGNLTGDILATIRQSIIDFVGGYDLGERIWANDIFALVERIAGTEVNFNSSDTYVTYNDIGVNDSNAPAIPVYAEWSVEERDISILFVN